MASIMWRRGFILYTCDGSINDEKGWEKRGNISIGDIPIRLMPAILAPGKGGHTAGICKNDPRNKSAPKDGRRAVQSTKKGGRIPDISHPGALFRADCPSHLGVVPVQSILILPALTVSLLILALALRFLSRRESTAARSIRVRHGIPRGIVVYSDLDRPGKVLFSKRYGIAGKPDYIIKDGASNANIPVEIKSGQAYKPYRNHVLQLAAYCLLVEENYDKPVPYGIIVYADGKQHKVYFDKALRTELVHTVQEMRRSLRDKGNRPGKFNLSSRNRGNDLIERCRFCSLQAECKQLRLTGAIDGLIFEG